MTIQKRVEVYVGTPLTLNQFAKSLVCEKGVGALYIDDLNMHCNTELTEATKERLYILIEKQIWRLEKFLGQR